MQSVICPIRWRGDISYWLRTPGPGSRSRRWLLLGDLLVQDSDANNLALPHLSRAIDRVGLEGVFTFSQLPKG